MAPTIETVEAAALQLTPAERADLIDRLIASLGPDPEIEAAWGAEAERRHTELERGTATLLAGPEALSQLKTEFR